MIDFSKNRSRNKHQDLDLINILKENYIMMNSYQILDIQRAFRWFGDEDTTIEMLNVFAMDGHFNY